jgi:hypothetical protein
MKCAAPATVLPSGELDGYDHTGPAGRQRENGESK